MTKRDQAHAKRCASVRFPGVEFAPMSIRANSAKARRIPKLGRHSSGQARVTLNGKAFYCGPWGTAEAHARYAELIRAWQDRGEQPAERAPHPTQASLRLGDLLQQFLDHVDATGRYRKNGAPTTHRAEFVNVIDSLTTFAGKVPVARMTEATLVAWRDLLERNRALTRTGINRKVGKVVQMLRWGRARGLVPKVVWADVYATEPLRRGEVGDRPEHGRPRRPVALDEVEKVAAHCAPQVGDMLRLQALCGMRPGEVLQMLGRTSARSRSKATRQARGRPGDAGAVRPSAAAAGGERRHPSVYEAGRLNCRARDLSATNFQIAYAPVLHVVKDRLAFQV